MNSMVWAVSAIGSAASTGLVWAAETTPDPSSIAPYVGGGAGVIAVTGLAEITRRLLNGSLIPRAIRDVEQELSAAILAAGQREDRMIKLFEDERRVRVEEHQSTMNALYASGRALDDLHSILDVRRREGNR